MDKLKAVWGFVANGKFLTGGLTGGILGYFGPPALNFVVNFYMAYRQASGK